MDFFTQIISTTLLGLIGYGLSLLRKKVINDIEHKDVREVLGHVLRVTDKVVSEVQSEYVNPRKRNGLWSSMEKRKAKILAMDRVKLAVGDKRIKKWTKATGNALIGDLVAPLVEDAVRRAKDVEK